MFEADYSGLRRRRAPCSTLRQGLLCGAVLVGGALAGLASPHEARAQTAGAAGAPTAEVVVTARRREESLQKVPTAVSVLGSQQLVERNVVSQSDLQFAVPGLTMRETQGSNSLTYSIRGQTVDNFTGSATAVVPYFDEVQLVGGGASTFFDLDSVQALKGPQGTLFGRNATGGAVLFTSTKPKNDYEGFVTARVGDYGLREGLGAVNLPIVQDKVLLRVAGDIVHRDGYQTNLYDDKKLGVVDRQSIRASLLVRPTERLENTTVVEFDHSGGNSTANRLSAVNACGATNGGFALNCTSAFLFSPGVDSAYGPGTWAAYLAANPGLNPAGIGAYLAQTGSKLPFLDANEAGPVYHREDDAMLVNTTTYDLGGDLVLKNIFGLSASDTRDAGSSVGAPYLVFSSENLATGEIGNHVVQTTYSDELQLQGKALNQALTYISGLYYQVSQPKTLFPQVYFDLSPLGPPASVDNHFKAKDETEAVYAQGTYDFRDFGLQNISLTAGVRYSWEGFTLTQLPGGIFPLGSQHVSFSNPSWNLVLADQVNDHLLLYVQGRRSWRGGGLNGTAPPVTTTAENGGNLFKPEYTRDVEIGAKFSGRVLDRPAHLDIAIYNQWIDNVQRAEFPVPPGRQQSIAVTINVPRAEVSGAELDASIKAAPWLDVGVSGALTDARFVKGANSAVIFGQEYVFNPYADAPHATGSLYGVVTLPTAPDVGLMDVRADIYGQSGMFFSNNNSTITPNTRIAGYGLLNLRYDWKNIYGSKTSLAVYVKNVTDKDYFTGGFALSASLGVASEAIGQPRMFGAELTYKW